MLTTIEQTKVIQATGFDPGKKTIILLWLGVAVGIISFLIGLATDYAFYAWQALLVNTLFFAGLAHGSLIFSVIFTITKAEWGRPIKRLAEATVLFIPVSWLLFGALFLGMDYFFEWTDPLRVIAAKTWWLNTAFFISRHVVLLAITGLVGMAYVLSSIRPDLMVFEKLVPNGLSRFARRFIKNKAFSEGEIVGQYRKHSALAPLYALLYSILTCIIAFDWIMSIDQEWYSTLFGFQYSIASLYAAAAFLVIVSSIWRKKTGLTEYLSLERHNDLSRLLFALCLFWTYFIFSQVLVIWYANIPEETPYLILRMKSREWSGMFIFLFVVLFLVPFIGLLSKRACRSPLFSSIIAIDVLIGIWLEKYFLTVPSIQENMIRSDLLPGLNLNVLDLTITIGILAAFLQAYLFFLRSFPALPIADPFLSKQE
ncbi:polysulfide reductase NrfD [bacterium]|nr:polysulfide reductase NrfD [bacterium]